MDLISILGYPNLHFYTFTVAVMGVFGGGGGDKEGKHPCLSTSLVTSTQPSIHSPLLPFPPCLRFCFQVQVVRDKVTWPGAVIKKTGEGMPNYENNLTKGDLLITVDVDFPKGSFQEVDKQGGRRGRGWGGEGEGGM